MKIKTAIVRQNHVSVARGMFDTEKHGDDMTFEGGLLTIRTKQGRELLTTTSNIVWMERATEKPAKKAAEK